MILVVALLHDGILRHVRGDEGDPLKSDNISEPAPDEGEQLERFISEDFSSESFDILGDSSDFVEEGVTLPETEISEPPGLDEEQQFISETFDTEPFDIRIVGDEAGEETPVATQQPPVSVVTVTETVTVEKERPPLPAPEPEAPVEAVSTNEDQRKGQETESSSSKPGSGAESEDESFAGIVTSLAPILLAAFSSFSLVIFLVFLAWYLLYHFIFRHNFAVQEIFGLPRTSKTVVPPGFDTPSVKSALKHRELGREVHRRKRSVSFRDDGTKGSGTED